MTLALSFAAKEHAIFMQHQAAKDSISLPFSLPFPFTVRFWARRVNTGTPMVTSPCRATARRFAKIHNQSTNTSEKAERLKKWFKKLKLAGIFNATT
jgi:hypothetical protein